MMTYEITAFDSIRVLEIYKMGIDTRNATFEIEDPEWKDWDRNHLRNSRFVFTENEKNT